MAQYPNVEDFLVLNSNTITPPPTFAAPPPYGQNMSVGASHEALHEQLVPPFTATQPPAFQTSTTARDENMYDRFTTLESMMKWLYENQLKLLESMQRILSNQGKIEETANVTNAALNKLSEDFNSWGMRQRAQ